MMPLQARFGFFYLLLLLSFTVMAQALAIEKAPDFTLTDIDGNSFSLSDCSAKVVLIDFFATWCSPCREAFPTFREFYDEYPRDQLDIVSISPEDADDLKVFAETPQTNMTWIVVSDPTGSVFSNYLGGDTRIPHMFLIDSDRYIAYDHLGWSGDADESELRSKINAIISGDYNTTNADQPGWPLTTIAIIVGIIIGLFIAGLIIAGTILGWSSSPKRRSKKRTRIARIHAINNVSEPDIKPTPFYLWA
jgi:peroxiredoxin